MNDEIFSDIEIEQTALDRFGQKLEVDTVIVRDALVGKEAYATVFVSDKRRLYAYVDGDESLVLADVKKIISRMNLVAAEYFPPRGKPGYFDEIGEAEFSKVFPGRRPIAPSDLTYYRTLAPYCPALVEIARVKDGQVRTYDPDAGKWMLAARYSYSRITAS